MTIVECVCCVNGTYLLQGSSFLRKNLHGNGLRLTLELGELKGKDREIQTHALFTGALTTKTKVDLQDIAEVLELTRDGQKKDINAVFRDNSRFEDIFQPNKKAAGHANDTSL